MEGSFKDYASSVSAMVAALSFVWANVVKPYWDSVDGYDDDWQKLVQEVRRHLFTEPSVTVNGDDFSSRDVRQKFSYDNIEVLAKYLIQNQPTRYSKFKRCAQQRENLRDALLDIVYLIEATLTLYHTNTKTQLPGEDIINTDMREVLAPLARSFARIHSNNMLRSKYHGVKEAAWDDDDYTGISQLDIVQFNFVDVVEEFGYDMPPKEAEWLMERAETVYHRAFKNWLKEADSISSSWRIWWEHTKCRTALKAIRLSGLVVAFVR